MGKENKLGPRRGKPQSKIGGLNNKEFLFCHFYAVGDTAGDGRKSAIKAGYSDSTAAGKSSVMLGTDRVVSMIEKLRGEAVEKLGLKDQAKKVLQQLEELCFFDIKDIYEEDNAAPVVKDPRKMPEHVRKSIRRVRMRTNLHGDTTIEVVAYDKMKALELLGKYHKLYTDKIEHSGSVAVGVSIYLPDNGKGPKPNT